MKKLTFEEWIETPVGKASMDDTKPLVNPYLKNRLWWAFNAGQSAWDVQYTTEYGDLLIALKNYSRLPKSFGSRIDYLINQHQLK